MAIVRELVTLLNFKSQGLQQAKEGMEEIRETARQVAFAVSLAAGALAVMVVRAGDQIQQDLNKLEGGLGSAQKAAEIYERIYESAKLTGIAVTSTAQAAQRPATATSRSNAARSPRAWDTRPMEGGTPINAPYPAVATIATPAGPLRPAALNSTGMVLAVPTPTSAKPAAAAAAFGAAAAPSRPRPATISRNS